MSKKTIHTNLIGRKVVLDYPNDWKNCKPEFQEEMKRDSQARRVCFGKSGEIVNVYMDSDGTPKYDILLEDDGVAGQIISTYSFAFTIQPKHEFSKV